jgi:nitrous oxidase accessory protein NosD
MKNKKRSLLLSAMMVFLSVSVVMPVSATDIYVGPGEDVTKIQEAVDMANPGDTIIVRDGTYNENVVVSKQLTLRSENGAASTTVQGNSYTHIFEVTDNYTDISGFTFTGAINSVRAGLYLAEVHASKKIILEYQMVSQQANRFLTLQI